MLWGLLLRQPHFIGPFTTDARKSQDSSNGEDDNSSGGEDHYYKMADGLRRGLKSLLKFWRSWIILGVPLMALPLLFQDANHHEVGTVSLFTYSRLPNKRTWYVY